MSIFFTVSRYVERNALRAQWESAARLSRNQKTIEQKGADVSEDKVPVRACPGGTHD